MTIIDVPTNVDIRNLVINELRKRDKLISKMQIRVIIKDEVTENLKIAYKEIDKLRIRLNNVENERR